MRRYKPDPLLDFRDHAVCEAILKIQSLTPKTFIQLSAMTREFFGEQRAWSPKKVHALLYYNKRYVRRLPTTIIGRDGQIRQFIENRAGRMTVSEITRQVQKRFRGRRVPSRQSVARFVDWFRRTRNLAHFV